MNMKANTVVVMDADALEQLQANIVNAVVAEVRGMIDPPKEFLTIAEAAEYLRVTRRTVTRRIQKGKLEAKHVGGTRMVRRPK